MTNKRQAKIVAGLRDLLTGIKEYAKAIHGSEEAAHDLICDLEDEIEWEPFSARLRSEFMEHVRTVFVEEEEAYTEKHLTEAKDWIREHRHTRGDQDNLAALFGGNFYGTYGSARINFEDASVHIMQRDHMGTIRMRYLSDAEIVEVWRKETART